jgi:hypothetical protein
MDNQFQTMPASGTTLHTRRRQVLIGVIFVSILMIVAAVLWYRARQNESNLPVYVPVATDAMVAQIQMSTSTYSTSTDADLDGIPNTKESALGTSNRDFDTDHDGLSDWDEIHVWKTNPLATDTDHDGYSDGVEVIRGYNPLGKGALTQ